MNTTWKKAWYEFRHMISEIDDRDNPITIFQHIRGWYQNNKIFLSPYLFQGYGLEELINIDIKAYPLDKSECTPQSIKRFLSLEPSSEETMIMFLRDELWEFVVLAVNVQCQRCGKLEMSALFDAEAKKVVLECTQCGLLQTTDGEPAKSVKTLKFAQNDDLKNAGLL